MLRDPVLTAQFCNEICWITPLATWAQRKVPSYGIKGSLHCRESGVGNAHGRSGMCETVLLMASEESEFTQTAV